MKVVAKMAIGIVLCFIYMWFMMNYMCFSEEMSTLEKLVGVVYGFAMIPLYEILTRYFKLR